MASQKLVGQNYTLPDLVAKVTGSAKYAEDYRAEGMLFAKLLLSPMPHARVTRIDTSAALAMPGVRAVLTADDLPAPADSLDDAGRIIRASTQGEPALTNEPLYEGEPILAVAAVDELTAAEAIERIQIDLDPLPFVIDPLETLRPNGLNPRPEGNHWVRKPPVPGQPPGPAEIVPLKWTDEDFAEYGQGGLPMGSVADPGADEYSYGDLEAGFNSAALVLDETFVTPSTANLPLETRSVLAYWQNGKLYVHCSTQSTSQTIPAIARWMGLKPEEVVVISEYTGGAFGGKVTAALATVIPALLSKKANAPVMMRVTREEEHYIGRYRMSFHARAKIGFARDGRITAMDVFTIGDTGPYNAHTDTARAGVCISLLYQPPAMRYRRATALTNTPPRGPQRQPGGMQAGSLIEPILWKAARQLGIDQVAIRRINAPAGKAEHGPPGRGGQLQHCTSAFVREALDKGATIFNWEERKARSGQRKGIKVRGVGLSLSTYMAGQRGFDGLLIIKPDGRLSFHSGIGNLGTGSMSDVHRVAAELLDVPWDRCDIVWGNTAKHLPWTCAQGGSSTVLTMTRAAHAAAMDAKKKLLEIAARDLGGSPEDYEVAKERVFRKSGGNSMALAQAARRAIELGGRYDGHEVPKDINALTKASAAALAGQGLMGVARDGYPLDGNPYSFVAGFAEVEVDLETGKITILDYLAVADAGIVLHPRNFGGQVLGAALQGMGHVMGMKTVYDPQYGVALAKRFYQNKPQTILDAPARMQWESVGLPDPETPVGARGIGEAPVGAGCNAVLCAITDALGETVLPRRMPITLDMILMALEGATSPVDPLAAHV